jgi:mono/diheme cytochrome c family protein
MLNTSILSRISLLFLIAVAGCKKQDSVTTGDTGGWSAERAVRAKAVEKHLADNAVAYRWFADFPFGTTEGIPYLILRSLPLIAPEEWGSQENFLSVAGLFRDERNKGYPIARGVGWSGLGREPGDRKPDYASFACGACHVGRVRKGDGSMMYLDGGINTEFNLVAYRVKVANTIKKMIGDETDGAKKVARATSAILKAIDDASGKDRNFFYGNYTLGNNRFDADYEANQIELFKKDAPSLVGSFLVRADLELSSLVDLVNKNYKGFEKPMLHGFGGMADATGVSMSIGFAAAKAKDPNTDPETGLPPTPGLTDFMAVWEQGKRKVQWNANKTDLIDGGGQWNGNIPLPMYRNMAAELTMGYGADTDVRIAAFAQELLEDLPAPPYPFEVDMELAKKGKTLFEKNCADCHRPHNGRVYSNIGTDLSRVHVVSPLTATNARKGFTAIGFPDRVVVLPPDGRQTTPFKEFEGVPLTGKADLSMRDPKDCEGYNALPLGGIWAQAPYLHGGSVPTLYHLLVPNERPDVFIKSRLDYDSKNVGFEWRDGEGFRKDEGYKFDTTAFPTVSKRGHDKDISEGGKLYKLDWSNDHDGAKAIIEYLKTL